MAMTVDLLERFGWIGFYLVVWILTFFVLWLVFKKKMPTSGLAIISFFLSFVLIGVWLLVTDNKGTGLRDDVIEDIKIDRPNLPENIQPQNLEPNSQINLGD